MVSKLSPPTSWVECKSNSFSLRTKQKQTTTHKVQTHFDSLLHRALSVWACAAHLPDMTKCSITVLYAHTRTHTALEGAIMDNLV